MRVLWVVSAWPLTAIGRPYAGIFYKRQADALRRLGAEVEIVLPLPLRLGVLRNFRAAKKAGLTPVPYIAFPQSTRMGLHHIGLITPFQRILDDRKPDLVHIHKIYPFATAVLTARSTSKPPVVATLHGSDIRRSPKISRLLRSRIVEAARSVDSLIAVGRDLGAVAETTTGRAPDIIPLGIEFLDEPDRASKEPLTEHAGKQSPLRVIFVGNLLEAKGVPIVLRVAEALDPREVQVTVVGSGPLGDACKRHQSVRYLGGVPNEVARELMRQSDLLLLPSESEGLPTVILEAGAEGLAVAAADIDGCRELLADGRGILINSFTSEEWANTIRQFAARRRHLRRMGRELQKFVREHYERDACTRLLLQKYRCLLERERQEQSNSFAPCDS